MHDTTQDADLRVTDAAVEAAARAVSLDWETVMPGMRAALEAAVPFLAPQPAALGPIGRRVINRAGSLGAWLESHLVQYSDAVLALANRGAAHD